MSVISQIASKYKELKSEFKLAFLIGVIIFSSAIVSQTVVTAYKDVSGLKATIIQALQLVPYIDFASTTAILTGIYLGLLALLFLDYKKRVQSLLLLFGTVICFIVFAFTGILFRFLDTLDYVLLLGSTVSTFYNLGRSELSRLTVNTDNIFQNRVLTSTADKPVEFPKAAAYLKWLMIIFVLLSLFEANVQYSSLLTAGGELNIPSEFNWTGGGLIFVAEATVSFLLVGSLIAFFEYDSSKRIVFVGPPRSGKTHLIIGLYSEAQNSNYNPRQVSEYLTQQREELIRTRSWAPETQAEVTDMGFQFSTQSFPSKNVFVDGLDYPGEYSYFIPEGLEMINEGMEIPDQPIDQLPEGIVLNRESLGEQISNQPQWEHLVANSENGFEETYKQAIADIRSRRLGGGDSTETRSDRIYIHMINSVLPRIKNADIIGFVFDVNEHLQWMDEEGQSLTADIDYYQRIMDHSTASEKIGIATKSDLLKSEFEEERFTSPRSAPDEFRKYVNDRLLNGPYRGPIQSLQFTLHPTYLETETNGDAQRPVMPLQTFGMSEILEEVGD